MAKTNSTSTRAAKSKAPALHAAANGRFLRRTFLKSSSRVATGLEEENASLDAITSETNELASSLKETATQAGSVAEFERGNRLVRQ